MPASGNVAISLLRPTTWLWPFPFGLSVDWLTVNAANPERKSARGRVYCLRGQGIVFSPGMALICEKLRPEGYYCRDLRCMGDALVVRETRTDRARGIPLCPIILAGHSAGGRAAIHASAQLASLGIPVALLITVDVAIPPVVPSNVRRAINIYRTNQRIYPAGPLHCSPDSETLIENMDLDSPQSPIHQPGIHHLNITSIPAIQNLILDAIRTTTP